MIQYCQRNNINTVSDNQQGDIHQVNIGHIIKGHGQNDQENFFHKIDHYHRPMLVSWEKSEKKYAGEVVSGQAWRQTFRLGTTQSTPKLFMSNIY